MTELVDKAYNCLFDLCEVDLIDSRCVELCQTVLDEDNFVNAAGAKGRHHAYVGGLMVHTYEVMKYALSMCETDICRANKQILIPAIIMHDYGKIYDYEQQTDGSFEYGEHLKLIYHLSRSYAEFMKLAEIYKVPEKHTNQIGHCILAHHGRKEWGSPVEPQTPEAHIIHFADMLSVNATKEEYID